MITLTGISIYIGEMVGESINRLAPSGRQTDSSLLRVELWGRWGR